MLEQPVREDRVAGDPSATQILECSLKSAHQVFNHLDRTLSRSIARRLSRMAVLGHCQLRRIKGRRFRLHTFGGISTQVSRFVIFFNGRSMASGLPNCLFNGRSQRGFPVRAVDKVCDPGVANEINNEPGDLEVNPLTGYGSREEELIWVESHHQTCGQDLLNSVLQKTVVPNEEWDGT